MHRDGQARALAVEVCQAISLSVYNIDTDASITPCLPEKVLHQRRDLYMSAVMLRVIFF